MKLTVTKSKNSASFYVQKSIRKKTGGTTSITIEKLGNIEEVRAKAGGKDPYIWAQEYVDELNRREYEEQKEIIVSYSPAKLIKRENRRHTIADICSFRRSTTVSGLKNAISWFLLLNSGDLPRVIGCMGMPVPAFPGNKKALVPHVHLREKGIEIARSLFCQRLAM